MHVQGFLRGVAVWCLLGTTMAYAIAPTAAEMAEARQWVAARWEATDATPFFSFNYDGRPAAELLGGWERKASTRTLDEQRIEHTLRFRDPKTGLVVRGVAVEYRDFPAVEWTFHLQNTSDHDSPILEKIRSLDYPMAVPESLKKPGPTVHYAKGALCSIDDFAPVRMTMPLGTASHLEPGGGRSSSEVLPFFNVEQGTSGVVLGIGWSGQWAADFRHDPQGLQVQAGLAQTHLVLHAGEEIRTPSVLLLFWKDDTWRGNNLLRRFLLAHHRPHPQGKPIVLPVLTSAWGGTAATEHQKTIQRIVKHDLPIDLYWIDAEWFGQGKPWWRNVGDWQVRTELYPQGFRAISDPLHASGRQFLLWIEPHRVFAETPWAKFQERPGWLLPLGDGVPEYQQTKCRWPVPQEDPHWVLWESRRTQIAGHDFLWNMGNPEARRYLTDWLSERIDEFGLDWYREDFNIAPWEFWQHADTPDRVGMTEIRFIEGLYAMWDELLQRHPHLAIDNCASGGRRIDLESIGRSTALWRTDRPADARHKQCHNFGLMAWVPLHMSDGTELKKGNEYELRSAMTAGLIARLPAGEDDESIGVARAMLEEYRKLQPYFYGDYYPLTAYSQAPDAWLVYQLDLPEKGEGAIFAFRRPNNGSEVLRVKLRGLEPEAHYQLTNLDVSGVTERSGRELMEAGLEISLKTAPASAVLVYRKL